MIEQLVFMIHQVRVEFVLCSSNWSWLLEACVCVCVATVTSRTPSMVFSSINVPTCVRKTYFYPFRLFLSTRGPWAVR